MERDAIGAMATKTPLDTPVKGVVMLDMITIGEGESFETAKRLIRDHGLSQLPVIDDYGRLVGVFSVRRTIEEIVGMVPSKI